MSVDRESTREEEVAEVSANPHEHEDHKKCIVCKKELSWFNRTRKCSRCKGTACRHCTAKMPPSGELRCQKCLGSGSIVAEVFSNHSPGANSTGSPAGLSGTATIPKGYLGVVRVHLIECRGLIAADTNILGRRTSSDPYCVLRLTSESAEMSSRVVSSTLNPVWDQILTVPVRIPMQNIRIEVYDKDVTGSECLGHVCFPLERFPSGQVLEGWLPIVPPNQNDLDLGDDQESASADHAGAIHVGIRFDYRSGEELKACISSAIATPPVAASRFEVNALYTPLMLIQELLWTRTLEPIVQGMQYVLRWESFGLSFVALLAWIYISMFVEYWPSVVFFILGGTVLYNSVRQWFKNLIARPERVEDQAKLKLLTSVAKLPLKAVKSVVQTVSSVAQLGGGTGGPSTPTQSTGDGSHADYEEQSLGVVVKKITLVTPGWVKIHLADYQPILRSLADHVVTAYSILFGHHDKNSLFTLAFLSIGLALYYIPFRLVVASSGAFLLFVMSPLMGLFLGLVQYLTKSKRWNDISSFGMQDRFNSEWASVHAVSVGKRKSHGLHLPKFGASL